jgi:hypothetical protein
MRVIYCSKYSVIQWVGMVVTCQKVSGSIPAGNQFSCFFSDSTLK